MTDTSVFDDLAAAWGEFQREYWDEWSAFIACAQSADWNEALQRQLEMFEHLSTAAMKLRGECIRAGIKNLERSELSGPLPAEALESIREQAERWFEAEQQALGTWMDTSRSLYAEGQSTQNLPLSPESAVETWRNTVEQMLNLQSSWLGSPGAAGAQAKTGRSAAKPARKVKIKEEAPAPKASGSAKTSAAG